MEKFLDKKYKSVRFDEHYEDYLAAIGLNLINRKLAKAIPSTTKLTKISDLEYAISTIVPFKTLEQKFVPGEETNAITLDGRNIRNIFTIEGNKLIERQIEPEREVILIREFFDNEIVGQSIVGDVICNYWCELVE